MSTTAAANTPAKAADVSRLSLVCVVDGSFSFAEHWTTVVAYIPPFLQHIAAQAISSSSSQPQKTIPETLQTCQIAIIVYGADTNRSCPLITRQHFINPQIAVRQLKEENELGIGSSSSADSRGMATLDALVSALEVSGPFQWR